VGLSLKWRTLQIYLLKLWHCAVRREKRQAPAPPVSITAVKDYVNLSENHSPAPAKPPRTYESELDQIENVEPVVAEAVRQTTTKRLAPPPPMSLPAHELSPLHTSTPNGKGPSPVKMIRIDENIDSPRCTSGENGIVETLTVPEDGQSGQTSGGSKPVDKVVERRETSTSGHVSSATLIFGGTAGQRSTPTKVAIVHKTGPSGSSQQTLASKAASQSAADDSVMDEPTSKPVAARLAAWQTKQVVPDHQEPLAVSSRVKNYERKITADEKTRTPLKPRTHVEVTASNSAKMSPGRGNTAMAANSPVKSVLSSPQKLSPATRAIHERLTQICEAGTRNEAVDRERKERAAELADVGNRWQRSPAPTAPTVSNHFI